MKSFDFARAFKQCRKFPVPWLDFLRSWKWFEFMGFFQNWSTSSRFGYQFQQNLGFEGCMLTVLRIISSLVFVLIVTKMPQTSTNILCCQRNFNFKNIEFEWIEKPASEPSKIRVPTLGFEVRFCTALLVDNVQLKLSAKERQHLSLNFTLPSLNLFQFKKSAMWGFLLILFLYFAEHLVCIWK